MCIVSIFKSMFDYPFQKAKKFTFVENVLCLHGMRPNSKKRDLANNK